jgi:hypothetical protein
LLLNQNEEGEIALHLAANGHHIEILEQLGALAQEEQLNSNKLKNKLLLAIDKYRYRVWHTAAEEVI